MRPQSNANIVFLLTLLGCSGPSTTSAETIPHPDKASAVVEYFVRKPPGVGPWPTVILLHGHQDGSRTGGQVYEKWGVLDQLAHQGYLATSISLPGYGGSSGPEDFAGPYTQHAVEAVLSALQSQHEVAQGKVLIEGVSLGALTAALVAAHDHRATGLVLISGLYDLPAFFDHPKSLGAAAVKAVAIQQTGGGDDALRSRSALSFASEIKASVLIMNGAKDDRTDSDQAKRLAEAINATGGHAEVRIFPDAGHEIPVKAREAEVDSFIAATLKR